MSGVDTHNTLRPCRKEVNAVWICLEDVGDSLSNICEQVKAVFVRLFWEGYKSEGNVWECTGVYNSTNAEEKEKGLCMVGRNE